MNPRARLLTYGTATALVVAGVVSVAAFDGLLSEVAAIALTTAGLGAAVLLVFLEVGLSEDRERARAEEGGPERTTTGRDDGRRVSLPRRPRRPG